ncbi:21331_t:CDS:1, partial [Racocetra persica]
RGFDSTRIKRFSKCIIISNIDELLFDSNQKHLLLNNEEHLLSNNQEHLLLNNQEYSLLNDQEITSSETIKQIDNTFLISKIIDLTNLSLKTDDQFQVDKLIYYNNKMFGMDNEFDL